MTRRSPLHPNRNLNLNLNLNPDLNPPSGRAKGPSHPSLGRRPRYWAHHPTEGQRPGSWAIGYCPVDLPSHTRSPRWFGLSALGFRNVTPLGRCPRLGWLGPTARIPTVLPPGSDRPFRANTTITAPPRALPSAGCGCAFQAPICMPQSVSISRKTLLHQPAHRQRRYVAPTHESRIDDTHEPMHEAGGRGGHEADMPFAKANGHFQTQPRATPSKLRPIPCALKGHPHVRPDAYPSRYRLARPFRANAASVAFPRALP